MNKPSSNIIVEAQLKQLGTIQKVSPPPALFDLTMDKIANIKKSYISMNWVRAAAAVFVFVLCAELVALSNYSNESTNKLTQQEELKSIIPATNYTLYND